MNPYASFRRLLREYTSPPPRWICRVNERRCFITSNNLQKRYPPKWGTFTNVSVANLSSRRIIPWSLSLGLGGTTRYCSGIVNPNTWKNHGAALASARNGPYLLSISKLDCESIGLMYGFDFAYRGNHNQLHADAIGFAGCAGELCRTPRLAFNEFRSTIQITLDETFKTHARINFEPRTTSSTRRKRENTTKICLASS